MLRILKLLIFLGLVGFIGLVGYAYLGDMSPELEEITEPVQLDAS